MTEVKKITVKEFSDELRKAIGTPFHTGGRVLGSEGGVDCAGLFIVTLKNLGYPTIDLTGYNNKIDFISHEEEYYTKNGFTKKTISRFLPGDIAVLRSDRMFHHLVYQTENNSIIHAWQGSGVNKVVESLMLPRWSFYTRSVWRFNYLED